MAKYDIEKIICSFLAIVFFTFIAFLICIAYINIHNGGYYCENCKETGIYGLRINAERHLGNHPCPNSHNSKHKVKYYWKDPRNKPQYIE